MKNILLLLFVFVVSVGFGQQTTNKSTRHTLIADTVRIVSKQTSVSSSDSVLVYRSSDSTVRKMAQGDLSASTSYSWNGGVIGTSYFSTNTTITGTSSVQYTFTGSSPATLTLPDRGFYTNRFVFIKNIGSADLTVAAAGTDDIYTTTAVTSITVSPGESVLINAGATGTSDLWLELFRSGSGGSTDLAIGTNNATTLQVTSSTGNDVNIPMATASAAGAMSAADKAKLDSNGYIVNGDGVGLPIAWSPNDSTTKLRKLLIRSSSPLIEIDTTGSNGDTLDWNISITNIPAEIQLAASDETTDITTGTAKITFRMPYAMTVTAVRASLTTASTSGTPTIDINEGGTTILSTKITIDANEKTSTTAATAPVISDTSLADDAEITIDVDVAGTGAKGLKVLIKGTRNP